MWLRLAVGLIGALMLTACVTLYEQEVSVPQDRLQADDIYRHYNQRDDLQVRLQPYNQVIKARRDSFLGLPGQRQHFDPEARYVDPPFSLDLAVRAQNPGYTLDLKKIRLLLRNQELAPVAINTPFPGAMELLFYGIQSPDPSARLSCAVNPAGGTVADLERGLLDVQKTDVWYCLRLVFAVIPPSPKNSFRLQLTGIAFHGEPRPPLAFDLGYFGGYFPHAIP